MTKKIWLLFITLALGLAACQTAAPVSEPEAQATEAPVATEAPEQAATATEAEPAATTEAEGSGEPVSARPASCTAVSGLPTPSPTERSAFPPIDEGDWEKGPEDAHVTIIEYGDFQ